MHSEQNICRQEIQFRGYQFSTSVRETPSLEVLDVVLHIGQAHCIGRCLVVGAQMDREAQFIAVQRKGWCRVIRGRASLMRKWRFTVGSFWASYGGQPLAVAHSSPAHSPGFCSSRRINNTAVSAAHRVQMNMMGRQSTRPRKESQGLY